ncbi:hypothetical protein [Pelomonas sp. SE-A7]|uniref:glucosamine inositolphosphorylceramide transferase family protein n=1 Tax=Pelomonas sp. SE-A7 TaxID=3054953 RepID=UPI00259C7AC2|nr:hypothetical protein [Pelomonas sp. SE-A7]MDM4765172.1 hypothetical protein [Pelomonas sp. SE-A7]
MLKRPRSDFWQVGVVPERIESVSEETGLLEQRDKIRWLPDPGPWRYLADPFGLQRAGRTHVFVEAYDYRTKHAVIERHEFGPDLEWRDSSVALARPFHLSYPYVVEDEDGALFMVPESHQAGEIALYRPQGSLDSWVRETALLPDTPGAEPSLIKYQGLWWMFFTVVGAGARDQRELHLAYAERLTGPWKLHPLNPVLEDRAGARPGGTPFVAPDGALHLPVQDCSRSYGGAIRILRITRLNEREFVCRHLPARLEGQLVSDSHTAGLHTLSSCGPLSLLDCKRVSRSRTRQWLDLQRRWRRLAGTEARPFK